MVEKSTERLLAELLVIPRMKDELMQRSSTTFEACYHLIADRSRTMKNCRNARATRYKSFSSSAACASSAREEQTPKRHTTNEVLSAMTLEQVAT